MRSTSLRRGALLLLCSSLLLAFQFVGPTDPLPATGSLGGPDRTLDWGETQTWLRGRRVFDHDFSLSEGVGRPHYNADSCRACHFDPVVGGSGDVDLNVSRVASSNVGKGFGTVLTEDPFGNPQILSRLTRSEFVLREEYDPAITDIFEQRNPPPLFGLGLVERIPAATILALQDPNDLNGDGIRGVARMLTVEGVTVLGRFGWKAQVPTMRDFLRDAMGEENGITVDATGNPFGISIDGDGISDPELSSADFDAAKFFLEHLAAPERAGSTSTYVASGELLFTQIGCSKCHTPVLQNASGPVRLFSNLLLHNVATEEFSGMEEPSAGSGFYRTPPLWGLRHSRPYMHDGSAETPFDAIRAHAGEATGVLNAYNALSETQQSALLAFLDDL
ncbi:MAG: hypothetical protein EXS14_04525 [Planctomycetes bacterium]|nr:hypothetical protein [Planctomycetota bacterium]